MRIGRRSVVGGGLALAAAGVPLGRAFAADKPPYVNRIAIDGNRVWIAAKIGDKGPYFFIIDTGAYISLINDAFAKSLGLSKRLGQAAMGIGGVSDHSWYNAGTVSLASGIRFPEMLFAGTDAKLGKDAVGSFGAGLFTTYDSDLDFAKGEWRAYTGGRPNFDGLVKLKSRFTKDSGGARIIADATVDGFEGDFLIDTGAPGEILLSGRAAANSGLWNDSQPYSPGRLHGIGKGSVEARTVRAKRLKIGPFVFERPLVRLSAPGTPSAPQDGIIGLKTLGLLHLTTDVSSGTLWAAPNEAPQAPSTYPLSGVWLEEERGRVVVEEVGTGSPAAAAGLRKGDVLIGGDLPAMIRAINGGPGRQISLKIQRGGTQQDLHYTLADYL